MKKVLIIEDESALREILADELRKEEFEVYEAEDGKEGLEIYKKSRPDIILLDIMMPIMNGLECMEKIRAIDAYTPIIMLTNVEPDDNIMKKIMQDPPSYYLVKGDIEIDVVITKTKEILKV